jgi:hypothetical protein
MVISERNVSGEWTEGGKIFGKGCSAERIYAGVARRRTCGEIRWHLCSEISLTPGLTEQEF